MSLYSYYYLIKKKAFWFSMSYWLKTKYTSFSFKPPESKQTYPLHLILILYEPYSALLLGTWHFEATLIQLFINTNKTLLNECFWFGYFKTNKQKNPFNYFSIRKYVFLLHSQPFSIYKLHHFKINPRQRMRKHGGQGYVGQEGLKNSVACEKPLADRPHMVTSDGSTPAFLRKNH